MVSRSSLIKIVSMSRKRARSAKMQRNHAQCQTFRSERERKNTEKHTRDSSTLLFPIKIFSKIKEMSYHDCAEKGERKV